MFRIVGSAGESGRAGWFLAKLGLAALLSGNVMMFQSLLYFGSLESLGDGVLRTASGIMLALSVAVYLLLGLPMLRTALSAARQRRIVLETLIALGALAAIGASAAETFRGGRRLYYDSGTMVLVFVVLGQYLDARARQKAAETLSPALRRERRNARVEREGEELEIAPEAVHRGERVRVRAGEEIPVDGCVLEGGCDVHEPDLTGEAVPRFVRSNDHVYAGSIAVDGALLIEASGESETLARRIERWTAEARGRRASIEIAADRFVSRFIPAVIFVALASAFAWGLLKHEWERGWLAALSVLVVACPCALGIATPMATTIALSCAAGRGTLLRSSAVLEAIERVRRIAFDKTGTITIGNPALHQVRVRPGTLLSERDLLQLAASVETHIHHPFAHAIVGLGRARVPGGTRRAFRAPPYLAALLLGALQGALPCTLVYGAASRAAVAGSPLAGGATMLVFGLGTVPAIFVLASVPSGLLTRLKAWRWAGLFIAAVGILLVLRGLSGLGVVGHTMFW